MPNLVTELFERVRHAATSAHRLHLVSKNYAEHVALASFYEALPDLVDPIIEVSKSRANFELSDFPLISLPRKNSAVEVVKELRDWIDTNRSQMPQQSEIQNLIDELQQQCGQTLYLLTQFS